MSPLPGWIWKASQWARLPDDDGGPVLVDLVVDGQPAVYGWSEFDEVQRDAVASALGAWCDHVGERTVILLVGASPDPSARGMGEHALEQVPTAAVWYLGPLGCCVTDEVTPDKLREHRAPTLFAACAMAAQQRGGWNQ